MNQWVFFYCDKPFQNAHLLHNLISTQRTYNIKKMST